MYLKSSLGFVGLTMLVCASTLYSVGSVKHVGSADEFKALTKKGKPMIAKFSAPWCGACKMMQPKFEEVAGKYGNKVTFVEVNIDEQRDLASEYGIEFLPTTVLFDARGEKLNQETGALSIDALTEHVNTLLAAPAKAVAVDDFAMDEEDDIVEPVAKPVMKKAETKETPKECKACNRQSCKRAPCKRCHSKKEHKEKKAKTTSED